MELNMEFLPFFQKCFFHIEVRDVNVLEKTIEMKINLLPNQTQNQNYQ